MCVRPCFPALHGLPPEVLNIVLKYLDVESKKNVRLVCRFLHQNFGLSEQILLKEWRLRRISAAKLKQFSDDVDIVKGIEIEELTGDCIDVDASIEYLVLNHPELRTVSIGYSSCTDLALQALMSTQNSVVIRVSNSRNISGENVELEAGYTLDLEVLDLGGCTNLTSKGLENILGYVAGDQLRELNLGGTKVSLKDLSCVLKPFPNIEILSLNHCSNITDEVLISFLAKAGGRLKKLDVSYSNIIISRVGLLTTSVVEKVNMAGCTYTPHFRRT